MDRRAPKQRWDDLADRVARVAEGPAGPDLQAVVVRLESAAGVGSFAGPDPDPWVTARRFSRVYAEAVRSGRYLDDHVLAIVDEGSARLGRSTTPITAIATPGMSSVDLHGPATWTRRAGRVASRTG